MSAPTTLPDALWTVLRVLAKPGRPALSYQEIVTETDISYKTLSRLVTTIVDYEWATLERRGRFYRVTVTDSGVEASEARGDQPTVKAVIAAARQICRQEATLLNADPYYRPYAPSDSIARSLCQQHGPETAIAQLEHRQAEHRRRYEAQEHISEEAERIRALHQRVALSERSAVLDQLSAGQRLDRALNKLILHTTSPAARLDTEPVTDGGGGKDDANAVPKLHDDPTGWAQRRVTRLINDLEAAVSEHERRRCTFEREAVA
ncbi:MAG: hypothetical protein JWP53_1641 [Conexibacter sp.]|nr:hypothetical protein [Conexibacter sp.]